MTHNGSDSKVTNDNDFDGRSENTQASINNTTSGPLVRLSEHNQSETEPVPDDSEEHIMEKQETAVPTYQPHASRTRHRLRTQSFPDYLTVSLRGIRNFDDSSQPTSSRAVTCPPLTQRHESRVGQLVHRFEMNHRFEGSDNCNPTSPDIIDTPTTIMDSNHTVATNISTWCPIRTPLLCYSSRASVSTTRAIDYRSIGFRPAFTTWEKRITEGNP